MLREHSRVLSLSEFYANIFEGGAFSLDRMDGRHFWSIVSGTLPFQNFCLQQGIVLPEWLYPLGAPTARFSMKTGVPGILMTTLPHLTDDHEALYDALQVEMIGWPTATVGEHYERLFGWLAARFGKRIWIERSGLSSVWIEQLLLIFPNARFINIVRDGRDTAMSIQEHLAFRLFLVLNAIEQFLGVNPFASPDRTHLDRVPAELRPFLPERFDVDAFRAYRVPLPLCGQLWAQQIEGGRKALGALSADRLLTLRYEDFFIDPKRQLDTFTAFLGDDFVDDDWSTRCAAAVRRPRSTWRELPEQEAHALTEACRPGFELLREAGVHYDV